MAYVAEHNTDNIRFDVAEIVEKDGRKYLLELDLCAHWSSYAAANLLSGDNDLQDPG